MKLKDILIEAQQFNIGDWGWNKNKMIEKSQIKKAIQNIELAVEDELFDKRFEITTDVSIVIYKNMNVEIVTELDIETKQQTVDYILSSLKNQLENLDSSK
jgi:hypothetical protein